jgi:hypothetical protein
VENIIMNYSNSSYFSVAVTYDKIYEGSISDLFSLSFGEVKGTYHQACNYKRSNSEDYYELTN